MSCPVLLLALLGVLLQLWTFAPFTYISFLSSLQVSRWNLPAPETLCRKQAAGRRCVTRSELLILCSFNITMDGQGSVVSRIL